MLNTFQVGKFDIFSDHAPLYFQLKGKCMLYANNDRRPIDNVTIYRWNSTHKDVFRRKMIGKLPDLNRIVNTENISDNTSIDKMIERFSFHIQEIAAPLFERNSVGNKPQTRNA